MASATKPGGAPPRPHTNMRPSRSWLYFGRIFGSCNRYLSPRRGCDDAAQAPPARPTGRVPRRGPGSVSTGQIASHAKRIRRHLSASLAPGREPCLLLGLLMAWCAASGLMASEYHGAVKAGGLPYPGVVVTAIQDGQRMVTTTDDQGTFHFSDLPDGTWTIEIRTLGFEPLVHEVGVSARRPAPEWELKFLPESRTGCQLGDAVGPRKTHRRLRARSGQAGGFQRVNVSQQADTGVLASQGADKDRRDRRPHPECRQFLPGSGQHQQRPGHGAAERLGPSHGNAHGHGPGGGRGGAGDATAGGLATALPAWVGDSGRRRTRWWSCWRRPRWRRTWGRWRPRRSRWPRRWWPRRRAGPVDRADPAAEGLRPVRRHGPASRTRASWQQPARPPQYVYAGARLLAR